MPTTNVNIYRAIADEAHEEMVQSVDARREPKSDGSEGDVITYDPAHSSFKQAMISIVFTGMWLEALMHILIVSKFDEAKFKEYDFKSYEDKLRLLGVEDEDLLNDVEDFRRTRKDLVHEKAFLDDGEIKKAQAEAELAHRIRDRVCDFFREDETS